MEARGRLLGPIPSLGSETQQQQHVGPIRVRKEQTNTNKLAEKNRQTGGFHSGRGFKADPSLRPTAAVGSSHLPRTPSYAIHTSPSWSLNLLRSPDVLFAHLQRLLVRCFQPA